MRVRLERPIGWTLWVALLALAAAGCGGGAIPKMHYYVLDLPPSPRATQQPPDAPYTLAVLPLRAPDQLEQDRIVYRASGVEVDFYDYHRWARRPPELVTSVLIDRLRARNVFANIFLFDGRTKTDYLLRGSLEHLEEVDSPGSVSVRADLSAELIDVKANRPVWTKGCSQTGPVSSGEVKAVVEAMTRAMNACVDDLTGSLETFAKSLPPAPAPASAASR